MSLSPLDFDYVRRLVHDRAAIALDDTKVYLARNRLDSLARQEGLGSAGELVGRLRVEPGDGLRRKVVEAMTTNETSFFRDIHPFEALRTDLLPELIHRRAAERRLTVWCAACSSGQEPYSLAMLLREHFPSTDAWDRLIVASDLSTEVLERARAGRYSQMEVNRGVPAALLVRHFRRAGLDWYVQDALRRMIDFRCVNLVGDWPAIRPPDLVFLRNVLIYFNADTKRQLLLRLARFMAPDGYLILGAAENVLGCDDLFERAGPPRGGAYRLRATPRPAPPLGLAPSPPSR
jgi:chemotaxis protein methyltransferase CheR